MKWVSIKERKPDCSDFYFWKGKGGYGGRSYYYAGSVINEGYGFEFDNDIAVNKVDEDYLFWLDEAEDLHSLENEQVREVFDLNAILSFQLANDVQIIRGEDYQYMCYINKQVWITSLTPMHALVFGIKKCLGYII